MGGGGGEGKKKSQREKEKKKKILKKEKSSLIEVFVWVKKKKKKKKKRGEKKKRGGGGGGGGVEKKFVQGRGKEKKSLAEGKSNCEFYLMYKMWQCLFKIILIQNILSLCGNQELCLKHSAVLINSMM